MIPKEIIEKAKQGGYPAWWDNVLGPYVEDGLGGNKVGWEIIALDPTFWVALGKACGWYLVHSGHNPKETDCGPEENCPPRWRYEAIRFYDLILQDKSTDTFWQELLNS